MAFMQVVELGSCFIEIFMGMYFIASALSNESIRIKMHTLGAISGAFIMWGCNQINLFSVYATILAVVGIAGISSTVYHLSFRDTILSSAFYMILLYVVDFFVLSVIGMTIGEDQIISVIISGMTWLRVCLIGVSKAALVLISWFLSTKILRNITILTRKLWITLIVFLVTVIYFVKSSFKEITIDILWTWFFILLFFILAVYTIAQYLRYMEEKENMNLALERNRIQLESYNELIQTYQKRQVFFHDLKNQYVVLGNYLKDKNYNEAERYIEELKMVQYKNQNRQYTGILPLDILLEFKAKEAERKNIRVQIIAERVDIPMSDQEAISLLGNAFDNAIEACEKIETDHRWIRIDIQQKRAMVFLKVVNSFIEQPVKQTGLLFTTKDNSQLHGLGLMSMQMIVDKYNGVMDVTVKNGEYAVSISFFC